MGFNVETRKVLVVGIGVVSLGLVASLGLLVSVLPKATEQQVVVAGQPNKPETEAKPNLSDKEATPDETPTTEVPEVTPEVEGTVTTGEPTITEPELGMSVAQLQTVMGEPTKVRAVDAAYVYEYTGHTFVVDEHQQTVIGYWLYPEQAVQPTEVSIDWQKGFAQSPSAIDWQGPYGNSGRGSTYVLYGYTTIAGIDYVIEFGADDELGFGNQLVAIYQQ